MFRSVSALFPRIGLAGNGLAEHSVIQGKIQREIEELRAQRVRWLWMTLAAWVITLLLLVLPILLSDHASSSDSAAGYLIFPGLASVKAAHIWTANGRRIRTWRRMLGE